MRAFEELESDLGYVFSDKALLKQALTHSSHAHEQNTDQDNEQLEFLGDAVLGFLISDMIFRAHPSLTEGYLSKLKGFLVSAANLVKFAEQLRLGEYLQLGKGEEKTGGRTKQALLVDAFEAVIGAVYLDGGIEPTRALLWRFLDGQVRDAGDSAQQVSDFKTALQEWVQSRRLGRLEYRLRNETGPDHQKLFTVEVTVDAAVMGEGIGLTRKAAEQSAARNALMRLQEAVTTHS